ncbi:MAG TPA: carbohydrate ABC transporter permease [Chloroflexia bacterium]|nr:carbohydrate ABC transporter permease [Chloroflexia bacterium]
MSDTTRNSVTPSTRPVSPAPTSAVESKRTAVNWQNVGKLALRYLAILLVLIFFILPFLWMVLSSFKTQIDITTSDNIFKFTPTTENYQNVFGQYNYLLYLWNSLLVAAASTFLSLVLGLPAAYAIARYKVGWLGVVLLTARIVPGITFLIPWYIIFSRIGLIGSYWSLILSHMLVGLPFIAWIMISFFESLPIDLEESAQVDGATPFGAFMRIALPLAVPGIVTASIMSFIFSWNNFMFSLVLAGEDTKTLPIAIFNFISYSSVDWGGLMAAAVIITLPVLVLTLCVQRFVVAGLTAGATKG